MSQTSDDTADANTGDTPIAANRRVIFCVTYLISINRQIALKNVLFSSFVASLIWYLGKNIFVFYAANNKTYLSIYGSIPISVQSFISPNESELNPARIQVPSDT